MSYRPHVAPAAEDPVAKCLYAPGSEQCKRCLDWVLAYTSYTQGAPGKTVTWKCMRALKVKWR